MNHERPAEQVVSDRAVDTGPWAAPPTHALAGQHLWKIALGALGVVFGDIGTSPLYAFRLCFTGETPVPPIRENVLGALSLICWALLLVVSIKYVLYVMRADNRGEGGILALLALLSPGAGAQIWARRSAVVLALFGAALLYGDGMITPAISVLSAVEGLELATPGLEAYVVPLTVLVLVLLFLFQARGTAGVGSVFGPVMLLWFGVIGVLGVLGVRQHPEVLAAIDPVHGLRFLVANGWRGYLVLGVVFLALTGAEALYADLGHFGRRPIRTAWFVVVFPALLLNYFGQGALLLARPQAAAQSFFQLAPGWALIPLVLLATAATIIASQAIISGAFSLTRQAALLGVLPRIRILQTSAAEIGQVFIPGVNWALMLATVLLVVVFERSSHLAGAYGMAVSGTMVITTVLAYEVARERWGWSPLLAGAVTAALLAIDLPFFGANLFKIREGGYVPLAIGGLIYVVMSTWAQGRQILAERMRGAMQPLHEFLDELRQHEPVRIPGTGVFLTGHPEGTPRTLLQQLEHFRVLHQQVVLLTVLQEPIPRVWMPERMKVTEYDCGFSRVLLRYGFMETPNVPRALRRGRRYGLELPSDLKGVTYYVGHQTIVPLMKKPRAMARWRERLFAFMSRNAAELSTFYRLPPEKVVEIGIVLEI